MFRKILSLLLVCCMLLGSFSMLAMAAETCEHSYDEYGNCTLCDYFCPHVWDANGWCSNCNNYCSHDFVDQRCTICGIECYHSWSEGVCGMCGTVCEHDYVSGQCTNCGATDPDYTPGETETAALVTNASTLAVGDRIVIVATGYDFALGTTQNTNNRSQGAVTKSENTVTFDTAAVQIITLAQGTTSGTFAFDVGAQYLYAASSSSNNLKTSASLTDNASWVITIDAATGAASVSASGTSTRNVLRYNSSSGLFSCYAATNSQKDIAIYRIGQAQHFHSYEAVVTAPTCESAGYTTYTCDCGDRYVADDVPALGHNYADGNCTNCGAEDPDYVEPSEPTEPVPVDYYLIGFINGANYGCEEDWQNLGQ